VGRLDPVTLMFGWAKGAAPLRTTGCLAVQRPRADQAPLVAQWNSDRVARGRHRRQPNRWLRECSLLWLSLTRVPQEVLKQGIQGGLFTNTFDAIAQTCGTSVVPQTGAFTKLMRDWQGFAMTNYVDVLGTPPATSASRSSWPRSRGRSIWSSTSRRRGWRIGQHDDPHTTRWPQSRLVRRMRVDRGHD